MGLTDLLYLEKTLVDRLGPEWAWDEDMELPLPQNLAELWWEKDELVLSGPDCYLRVGARAAGIYFVHSIYWATQDDKTRERVEKTIAQVCDLFRSPSVVVVPDNAYELSGISYLYTDGWSFPQLLQMASEDGAAVESLQAMYVEGEEYWDVVGYPLLHYSSEPHPEPPAVYDESGEKWSLEELLAVLEIEEIDYKKYPSRLLVKGEVWHPMPEPDESRVINYFIGDYRQDVHLCFFEVSEYRYTKPRLDSGIYQSSTWLSELAKNFQGETAYLKHYVVGSKERVLEVAGIHCVAHLTRRGGRRSEPSSA